MKELEPIFHPVIRTRIDVPSVVPGRVENVWIIRPQGWTPEEAVRAFKNRYPGKNPNHPFPIGEEVELTERDLPVENGRVIPLSHKRGRPKKNPLIEGQGRIITEEQLEKRRSYSYIYYRKHREHLLELQKSYRLRDQVEEK